MKTILLGLLLTATAYAAPNTKTATETQPTKIQLQVYSGFDATVNLAQPLQVIHLETTRPNLFQVTVKYGAPKTHKFADTAFWRTAYVAEFDRTRLADWLQCLQFDPEAHTCATLTKTDLSGFKKNRKRLQEAVAANFNWIRGQKLIGNSHVWVNGEKYDRPLAYGQLLNDLNDLLPKTAKLKNLETYKPTKLYAIGNTKGLGRRDLALEKEFYRWVPNLHIEALTPDSKQGQKLLKSAEAKGVPAYIFDRTSRHNVAVQKLAVAGRTTINKSGYGIFDLRSGATEIKSAGKVTPKTLDLWVMSQCPYGVKAETALMAAIDQKLLPEGTKVQLRFIANEVKANGKKEWRALHGEPELTENIRQLAIQATWPDKLWAYLKIRNTDYKSDDWQTAAKAAGLDPEKVEAKMSLGRKLMAQDIKDGEKLSISGSPTYLWENTYVLQTAEDFQATVGYNPQEIKTAEQDSARKPASAPAAAPAAGGQCG